MSFFFVMNEAKYNSLPENVQTCIDEASGETLVAKFGDWWDAWDAPGKAAAEERGSEITVLSDEERAKWGEAMKDAVAKHES